MFGRVISINKNRGMAAFFNGLDYTIIEVTDSDNIEVGDLIQIEETPVLGTNKVLNKSKGEKISVVFQNLNVSSVEVKKQLLLK